MSAWIKTHCGCCAGIAWGGESPRECDHCWGNGIVWISNTDRLALYPGGPLLGSDPGRFAAAAERVGVRVALDEEERGA